MAKAPLKAGKMTKVSSADLRNAASWAYGRKYDTLTFDPKKRDKKTQNIRNATQALSLSNDDRCKCNREFRRLAEDNPIIVAILNSYVTLLGTPDIRANFYSVDEKVASDADNYWARAAESLMSGGQFEDEIALVRAVVKEGILVGNAWFLLNESTGRLHQIVDEQVNSPNEGYQKVRQLVNGKVEDCIEIGGIILFQDVPVAYRVYPITDDGDVDTDIANSTVLEAKSVIHYFNRSGAHSYRGVGMLMSVSNMVYDLDESIDAKVAQVKSICDIVATLKRKAGSTPDQSQMEAMMAAATGSDATPEQKAMLSANKSMELSANNVPELPEGSELDVIDKGYHGEDFVAFVNLLIGNISSVTGLPAAYWYSKYADVNFSGSKAISKDLQITRDIINRVIVGKVYKPVHRWTLSRGISIYNKGDKENGLFMPPKFSIRSFTFKFKVTYAVDEQKEQQANAIALKSGAKTVQDIIEEKGEWADEEIARRCSWGKKFAEAACKAAGITDPARIANAILNEILTTVQPEKRA